MNCKPVPTLLAQHNSDMSIACIYITQAHDKEIRAIIETLDSTCRQCCGPCFNRLLKMAIAKLEFRSKR